MAVVETLNGVLRRVPTWPVYGLGLAPMVIWFWMGATGRLGPEPIEALENRYGLTGLQFLLASLLVTPLRRWIRLNLLSFRRALGLLSFFYVLAHLSVWALLDMGSLAAAAAEILKRPFITVGMVGFALLVPLALTSNDWSVRRLGARWRRLHRLAYGAVLLGGVHYVMLAKGFQLEPLVYLAAAVALVAVQAHWQRARLAAAGSR